MRCGHTLSTADRAFVKHLSSQPPSVLAPAHQALLCPHMCPRPGPQLHTVGFQSVLAASQEKFLFVEESPPSREIWAPSLTFEGL